MRAIPVAASTFIGRRRELVTLQRLLRATRLLTLTGAGGIGKTRLATELARLAKADRLVWVDLAVLRDPGDLLPAIERALGMNERGALDPATLAALFDDDRVLVVLDNCEHLVTLTATAAERLLAAIPRVQVLATSRSPLRIDGEVVWRVPALSLPVQRDQRQDARALDSDAVRLFVERARAASPRSRFDVATMGSVARICAHLGGIPLAIELAAARTRHVGLRELDELLRQGIPVLTADHDDERHRTMDATIDWSYRLLADDARFVFRALSVFAGGTGLAGIRAVCAFDRGKEPRMVEAVSTLIDSSLLEFDPATDRYRMLEPIRAFAAARLAEAGGDDVARERCAVFLAERLSEPDASQAERDLRLGAEFPSVLALLPWLVSNDPRRTLQLLAPFATSLFTSIPVHLSVVAAWTERALHAHRARDAARGHGLVSLIFLRIPRSDRERSLLGELRAAADEALAIALEIGDATLEGRARTAAASIALREGPPERAIHAYDAAIPHLTARDRAFALAIRADLKQTVGDREGARRDLEAVARTWAEHTDPMTSERAMTFMPAADIAFRLGDLDLAESRIRQGLEIQRRQRGPNGPTPFALLAHVAALRGDHERALRLAGVAARIEAETGLSVAPYLALSDRGWTAESERIAGQAAPRLVQEGWVLPLDDAIRHALGEPIATDLSRREREVAVLVAEGLTDKEIAARLDLSARTVENHVQHVREKLGLRSRAQIGHWIADHVRVRGS